MIESAQWADSMKIAWEGDIKHINTQTHGHRDYQTESAQWADSVKNVWVIKVSKRFCYNMNCRNKFSEIFFLFIFFILFGGTFLFLTVSVVALMKWVHSGTLPYVAFFDYQCVHIGQLRSSWPKLLFPAPILQDLTPPSSDWLKLIPRQIPIHAYLDFRDLYNMNVFLQRKY